ncbi:MAG TPA: GntR family transcriptional regulator [Eoetvoesiella sp.]
MVSKSTNPAAQPFKVLAVAAPVRAQVVANLRMAILTGRFQPGERLVEATLCDLLQVSRASLREALRQLEAEKLITITPFKGPTVTAMTMASAEQIYEMRALLEAHAAKRFATAASAEDIATMREALTRFEKAVHDNDAMARIEATDDFYMPMLNSWGNEVVIETLKNLQGRINFLRYKSMSSPERSAVSLKEMGAILDAIENRSPSMAAAAAKFHVERARDAAKKMLE